MNTLNQLTDDELVKLYEAGNNKAFEILLLRYKSKAYTYIYLIVRKRELADIFFRTLLSKLLQLYNRVVMSNPVSFWHG